jgi:hypothetical protein
MYEFISFIDILNRKLSSRYSLETISYFYRLKSRQYSTHTSIQFRNSFKILLILGESIDCIKDLKGICRKYFS